MKNKYSEQRDKNKRGDRGRSHQGMGADFTSYGRDRQDSYFGGGGQGYGQGMSSSDRQQENYQSSWRDSDSNYPESGDRNRSEMRQPESGNYDRDNNRSGRNRNYGSDNRTGPEYSGHGSSGQYNYGVGGSYGEAYPDSERGYMNDRERRDERGWWDRTSDEVSSWFGDEEAERRREMDSRRDGEHRGRGPKGYKRSDDRIKEDVNDRLTDNGFLNASNIEVELDNGDVILTGTVDSRYEKRLAEDIAEDVSGVSNVENRLRVKAGGHSSSHGTERSNSQSGDLEGQSPMSDAASSGM